MKVREFNKILNSCCIKRKKRKVLSIEKINKLDALTKTQMVVFLANKEAMILKELVTKDCEFIDGYGYFYEKELNGYNYLAKSKHMEIKEMNRIKFI